ncbi:MAG: TetR/AcrR family transcriptional regulator [Bacteroidales bacterium]|nr:TetR/AcrR family transcriptional regulator [Bacteroidales bacterium]
MVDKEKIKIEILCAAERLFERYGYDKTTIEDISGESNKAKTAVYYYFRNKSEIFHKVIEREFHLIRENLTGIREGNHSDRVAELSEYLKQRMELIRATTVYSRYLSLQRQGRRSEALSIISNVRDDFDRWEREYFEFICREGNSKGLFSDKVQPEPFGEMMVMLLKGLEFQFVGSHDPDLSKTTYEEVLDRILLGCTK